METQLILYFKKVSNFKNFYKLEQEKRIFRN